MPRDKHRTDERKRVAQQTALLAAHGKQADCRRADDRNHRARHGFALNRLMQQHAGKCRDKERLRAYQRRRNKRRSKAERCHPAGVVHRKQEARCASQHDLFLRCMNDSLQFAAPERGNQQKQKAECHAPKGNHHGRCAAGHRPLDHRTGNAHARHRKEYKKPFLSIVHVSPFSKPVQAAAKRRRGNTGNVGALPQTPQGNIVPLTLTTLSLRDS